ncbi:MAG: branched-chain amino acid ABC transporter permease [Limnochordales bacterium]
MGDLLANLLNPYNLQLVMLIAINGLLGLSVWVPLSAGQLSLGGAGFMSVGAYTAALLTLQAGWSMPAAILAGAAFAAALALLLGYPTLRLQGVYLAIATLAFGEMVRILALNLRITNGALGLAGIPQMVDEVSWYLWDHTSLGSGQGPLDPHTAGSLIILGVLYVLLAAAVYALLRQAGSRVGRALRAIQADELAARAMGIDTRYYKLLVFTQSGFLAGLAGGLYAHLYYFIGPGDFGFTRAIEMLLYVVLGGMQTLWGTLVGASALTLLPEVLRFSASYRLMIYGGVLVALMIFRPEGLISAALVDALSWRRRRPARALPPGEGAA